MSAISAKQQITPWWQLAAVAVALVALYATVLIKLGQDWWQDPNYSHGLLIPFVIGYILWSERARFSEINQRPATLWGGIAVALAFIGLWSGTAGAELYVQRMSLVLMIIGIAIYFAGWRLLPFISVPLLLLLLSIPVPSIIFNKIAFPLQLFASRCAVSAMRLFDIPVLREGNVIELMPIGSLQTKKLEVVEACSGIRSLMTLVTLAVVFAYFTYPKNSTPDRGSFLSRWSRSYGFWRSVIIVAAAVPIAIITNALRVSGTGVLARYYGTEVADGFFHSFSGWVIYIVSLALLFGVGWVIDRAVALLKKDQPAFAAGDEAMNKEVSPRRTSALSVKGIE